MTAKEKATAIVKQFWMAIPSQQDSFPLAIKLAITHVKGIIEVLNKGSMRVNLRSQTPEYWQQVLTELNKM